MLVRRAKKKESVTREEMTAELDELNGAQRTVDTQLAQLRIIFNKMAESLNQFMATTNKTLEAMQNSEIIMTKRLEDLEDWVNTFSEEFTRRYNEALREKREK